MKVLPLYTHSGVALDAMTKTGFEIETDELSEQGLYDSEEENIGFIRPTKRDALFSPRNRTHGISCVASFLVMSLMILSLFGAAAYWRGDELAPYVSEKPEHDSTDEEIRSSVDVSTDCEENVDEPIILTTPEEDNGVLRYACPCAVTAPAANIDAEDHMRYNEKSQRIVQNVTNYLTVFRNMEFDDWGHSYEEVKQGMYEWKRRYFSDLRDGSKIYESACGTGMNLFMTLEILEEVKGTKNLVVYGNEYVSESVQVATEIARSGALPANGRLGSICPGDSTNLRHVPENSFDLVYSGYIAPLLDPLELKKSVKENYAEYTTLCENDDDESVRRRREAQNNQEAWYVKWIQEMIRIAKPGAPIISEQISYP